MTDIEDLQIQMRRMQAMLSAQQHLLLALFEHIPSQAKVLKTFSEDSQTSQDLLLAEGEVSDQDIADGDTARGFLLRSLEHLMKPRAR